MSSEMWIVPSLFASADSRRASSTPTPGVQVGAVGQSKHQMAGSRMRQPRT
jgi:hypothetical protein